MFPPLDQQRCGNCRYARCNHQGRRCHRHAPQIGPRGSEWPIVAASDWCGEWVGVEVEA